MSEAAAWSVNHVCSDCCRGVHKQEWRHTNPVRIPVPPGTVVKRKRGGALLGDLTNPGKPGMRNASTGGPSHLKEHHLAAQMLQGCLGRPKCRLLTGHLQCLAKLLNKPIEHLVLET